MISNGVLSLLQLELESLSRRCLLALSTDKTTDPPPRIDGVSGR